MPTVGVVRDDRDLEQILALQAKNVVATADGFVTVRHTLPILRAMHAEMPSVVARDERGDVVAYALAMPRSARASLPILTTMFARLDANQALAGLRWYVMGQVCVDER